MEFALINITLLATPAAHAKTFNVGCDGNELIAAINTANGNGDADTIELSQGFPIAHDPRSRILLGHWATQLAFRSPRGLLPSHLAPGKCMRDSTERMRPSRLAIRVQRARD